MRNIKSTLNECEEWPEKNREESAISKKFTKSELNFLTESERLDEKKIERGFEHLLQSILALTNANKQNTVPYDMDMNKENKTMKIKINTNFEEEWRKILNDRIEQCGIQNANHNNPGPDFYSWHQFRRIPTLPRTVHEIKDLTIPPDVYNGYQLLLGKLRNGEDVNSHLSKKALDARFTDLMLFDWGLHHLHLGTEIESDGYINRKGPMLAVKVIEDHVFIAGIVLHSNGENPEESWIKKELLENLESNWPGILPTLNGISGTSLTTEEIRNLRKKNAGYALDINGISLIAGNRVASGLPIRAVMDNDMAQRALQQFSEMVKNHDHGDVETDVTYRLKVESGILFATNTDSGDQLRWDPSEVWPKRLFCE